MVSVQRVACGLAPVESLLTSNRRAGREFSQRCRVGITEALVGGRVGNPRGLTAPGAGPGSARGRDSPRRPPARGRHSHCPGWGRLTLAPTVRVIKALAFRHRRAPSPECVFPDVEHDARRVAFLAPHCANELGEGGIAISIHERRPPRVVLAGAKRTRVS